MVFFIIFDFFIDVILSNKLKKFVVFFVNRVFWKFLMYFRILRWKLVEIFIGVIFCNVLLGLSKMDIFVLGILKLILLYESSVIWKNIVFFVEFFLNK